MPNRKEFPAWGGAVFLLALFAMVVAAPVWSADEEVSASRAPVVIVDTHAHLLRNRRGNAAAVATEALAAMDRLGVEKVILLPPPFPQGHRGTYGRREIDPVVRARPDRFAFIAGGESLNPMIQSTAPDEVTQNRLEQFQSEAQIIVDSGAAGFGEIAAEHFSSGRGGHPYESARADHPLLLALCDIAARNGMPIDLHMEAVPRDMPLPDRLMEGANPKTLRENISGLERLLSHNRSARIVWSHAGWDLTGERSPTLMRSLLEKHSNLYMSIKVDRHSSQQTSPFDADGNLRMEWIELLRAYPDRFMIGSDQFFDDGSERLSIARKLVDSLPAEVAKQVASENAMRIYRLHAAGSGGKQ